MEVELELLELEVELEVEVGLEVELEVEVGPELVRATLFELDNLEECGPKILIIKGSFNIF